MMMIDHEVINKKQAMCTFSVGHNFSELLMVLIQHLKNSAFQLPNKAFLQRRPPNLVNWQST